MPAYNEERAIARMVPGCKKYVDRVVVDDGSTDRTAMGARKEPQIHSPPPELSAFNARGRAGNTDKHRYDYNNFINIFQPEPATGIYQLQPQQTEVIP